MATPSVLLPPVMYRPGDGNAYVEKPRVYRALQTDPMRRWIRMKVGSSRGGAVAFPAGTQIAAKGYVVIAKTRRLSSLSAATTCPPIRCWGDYAGELDNMARS